MPRKALFALALMATSPAMAQEAEIPAVLIENCSEVRYSDKGAHVTCEVTNKSAQAIAGLTGTSVFAEPDRSIPWGAQPFQEPVPGGIEPAETRAIKFPHVDIRELPYGADAETSFKSVRALNANGETLISIQEEDRLAAERVAAYREKHRRLSQEDAEERVQELLGKCWSFYALILESSNPATFELGFEFNEDAKILWPTFDSKPISDAADEAMQKAIKMGQDSMLRCKEDFAFNPRPVALRATFSPEGVDLLDLKLAD